MIKGQPKSGLNLINKTRIGGFVKSGAPDDKLLSLLETDTENKDRTRVQICKNRH